MTAIANLLLEGIKQYAQSLKKQLDIPLAKAQELTAKANCFADWHELITTASRNPLDDRLRGAAVNRRSTPAVLIPSAVEQSVQAGQRMSGLAGLSESACIASNSKARGFMDGETISPSFHFDLHATHVLHGKNPGISKEPFRLNLFDPQPRFVAVWGSAGWGKSALALSIGIAHASQGGNVCHLDPFIGDTVTPSDWAGKMRNAMLEAPGGSKQIFEVDGSLQPFSKITGLGCTPYGTPRPSLDVVLRNIRERLLPFSVLLIDEPVAFASSPEQNKRVAHEIDLILASGSAVVWLSQDFPTEEILPLHQKSQENAVLFIGKTYSFAPFPEKQAALAEISKKLPMKRGVSNSWIAAVSTKGRKQEAYIVEALFAEIESQAVSFSKHTV